MLQEDGTFFWYGTTQKYAPAWISKGINLYSSKELQHWKFEGQIFNDSQIQGAGSHHPYRIERPKVDNFVLLVGVKKLATEQSLTLRSSCIRLSPEYKELMGQ